ncbi:MAG: hypothetical protein E6G34_09850 [Actinobacteria bacterium]|nr:MAG: hypothetical protein E6G34_09850 [Actinomycetota bacterium]
MSEPRPQTEDELIELVRSIDVRAPESLHRRVDAMLLAHSQRRRRAGVSGALGRALSGGRGPLAAAGAAAVAAGAVAAIVALSTGPGRSLSLQSASALTLRPATAAAPRESKSNRDELAASVQGVSFPYWAERVGWRSVGARSDRLDGRAVRTVFYSNDRGARIGYAIFAGSPPRVSGGVTRLHRGLHFRLLNRDGVAVVSWRRGGHLCVMSGIGISAQALMRLATLGDRGALA